jgi:hypothetical protein
VPSKALPDAAQAPTSPNVEVDFENEFWNLAAVSLARCFAQRPDQIGNILQLIIFQFVIFQFMRSSLRGL